MTHTYTQSEKDQVIARLKADPKLAMDFLSSAQSGNLDDLDFLMQLDGDLFVSGNKVVFAPFSRDDPRLKKKYR